MAIIYGYDDKYDIFASTSETEGEVRTSNLALGNCAAWGHGPSHAGSINAYTRKQPALYYVIRLSTLSKSGAELEKITSRSLAHRLRRKNPDAVLLHFYQIRTRRLSYGSMDRCSSVTASDPDRPLALLRYVYQARPYVHARARVRAHASTHVYVSARPRADACTLVIVLHTHVRVVRGVVLRRPVLSPPGTAEPLPAPRTGRSAASQFPSLAGSPPATSLPSSTSCYTWSPPVRSVLSPSRGSPLLLPPDLTSRGH